MMTPAWGFDWAWSVPLTAITLAIHVVSIIGMVILLSRVGTLILTVSFSHSPPVAVAAGNTDIWAAL